MVNKNVAEHLHPAIMMIEHMHLVPIGILKLSHLCKGDRMWAMFSGFENLI